MDLISVLMVVTLALGVVGGVIYSAQFKGVKKCQELVSLRKAERTK